MATPKAAKTEKTVAPPPAQTSGPQQTSSLANVPTSTGLSSAVPAWLQKKMQEGGMKPRGFENMGAADYIFPRLVLAQALTPQVVARSGMNAGDIFDNLSGEILLARAPKGAEQPAIRFIPVVMNKSRLWLPPLEEGGSIKCRSVDSITSNANGMGQDQGGKPTRNCADCIFKEFDDSAATDKERKPKCTEFINIIGILPDYGDRVMVWSLKSTGIKVARKLLSLSIQTKVDFWGHAYALRPIDAQNAKFQFQNWDFTALGYSSEREYNAGSALFALVEGKTVAADISDVERELNGEPGSEDAEEPSFP